MKKTKLSKGLKKFFSIGQVDQIEDDTTDVSYRSLSDSELKSIVKSVYVSDLSNRHVVDKFQIPSMLEPIGRELIDKRADHDKLMTLAPEIEQAASILIPSILSPNDFRKNIFEIAISGGNESDETKTEIIELIRKHFDDELKLSIKLSDWVNDAMFRTGSKPVMIIPTSTIANIRNNLGGAVENLHTVHNFVKEIDGSVENIKSRDFKGNHVFDLDDVVNNIFETGVLNDLSDTSNGLNRLRTSATIGVKKAFDFFDTNARLSITDNPYVFFRSSFKNAASLEAIDSSFLSKLGEDPKSFFADRSDGIAGQAAQNTTGRYSYNPYIDLSEFIHEDKSDAYPAMIELPSESVIPIIMDGSPDNHLGYFVLINENGSPLSINNDTFGEYINSNAGSQRVNSLYSAFYGTGTFSIQKKMAMDAKAEILNSIYDSFIRNMMQTKLNKLGIEDHRAEISSDISRMMFTRLLRNAETRIVFVPKRFMLYMAFQYNNDGTGRSKIENIKFPLSLKMTFVITRLISLIESAINRRSLNITLDDGIGNPIELLRSVKKDIINNKMYGLTYDPSTIIKNVLEKELTIIPNKIPGVEEFSLNETANNVEYPRPDDALLDEINNMYMLSLGVPPSAMNRLSEDEFSRSVAANNIFFSNQLKSQQRVVCNFMTDLISTYITFSRKLKTAISEILENAETKDTSGTVEAKNDSDEVQKLPIASRLNNVIRNINFTLPSPNLAQDRSSFEELREYMEIVDAVLNALFPDDITSDGEVVNVVKVLRAHVKRSILQTHIKDNSILSDLDFDALADVDVSGMIDSNTKLLNLKTALDNLFKAFNPTNTDTDSGSSW